MNITHTTPWTNRNETSKLSRLQALTAPSRLHSARLHSLYSSHNGRTPSSRIAKGTASAGRSAQLGADDVGMQVRGQPINI